MKRLLSILGDVLGFASLLLMLWAALAVAHGFS